MWARSGLHGGEQEPKKVAHSVSIADLRSREVLPPHRLSRQPLLETPKPCSAAQTPICVRETNPSLFKMCSVCAATVRSVITSASRICRFAAASYD